MRCRFWSEKLDPLDVNLYRPLLFSKSGLRDDKLDFENIRYFRVVLNESIFQLKVQELLFLNNVYFIH